MENKHTPGPWKVDSLNRIYDDNDLIVCLCSEIHRYPRESIDANAHLIAAAPDMLEALYSAADLQHATENDNCTDETLCLYCTAIAKAEGGV